MHFLGTDSAQGTAPEAPSAAPAGTAEGRAGGEYDALWLALISTGVSLAAFIYFFRQGQVLLYGDATAHIHIARRVFDSRTPGPAQLGTVWLPLPHLLIIPFILSHWAWHTGLGGSVPSMIAYVLGTLGIFRLVRGALPHKTVARVAAWSAAAVYGLNPNLIYLQATAMTEPLYLALFVWATVYFSEFVQACRATGAVAKRRRTRALRRCAWMLFAAMLTRYDGWFAAVVSALAAFIVLWEWTGRRIELWRSPLRPVFMQFVLIVAAAPGLWFAYNTVNWGNPLEFATGPYSAAAIEAGAQRPGGWHHPGWHAPKVAAIHFFKSAKLNMAGDASSPETGDAPALRWRFENAWPALALLGTALLLGLARLLWPYLLLWVPLPFYAFSIAWGSVPIFLPVWWPYSYYNVRYGLQLLPAFAVFTALVAYLLASLWPKLLLIPATTALILLVASSYFVVWRATPICLREAQVNSASRVLFDRKLANELQTLPPGSTVLMYTATHAAALEFAGFPLRHTINETNDQLWRAALIAPAQKADYVIAFETPDDPLWPVVQQRQEDLRLLTTVDSPGQPRALLYRRR